MRSMRAARLNALAAICALAAGCRAAQEPTRPAAGAAPVASPEYAVYSAVLDSLYGRGAARPRYVLSDSTVHVRPTMDAAQESAFVRRAFGPLLAAAAAAALPDFRVRSAERVALRAAGFRTRGSVELVSARDLGAVRGGTSHISLSRAGFDPDGGRALVYVSRVCGSLCGDGVYVLLERRGARWVVLKYVVVWES